MFGMGFTEMLLIAIVAVIFLGPEKLPGTMVEIAKIFKKVKSAVTDMKETIDDQLQLTDIKNEALSYKQELLETKEQLKQANPIDHFKEQAAKAKAELGTAVSSADEVDEEIKKLEREQKELPEESVSTISSIHEADEQSKELERQQKIAKAIEKTEKRQSGGVADA